MNEKLVELLGDFCDGATIEYIEGLLFDRDTPSDDKSEILRSFLFEFISDKNQISDLISELITLDNEHQLEVAQRDSKQKLKIREEAKELELKILRQLDIPSKNDAGDDGRKEKLSEDEILMKKRMVETYGYQLDEIVEGADGETEILYTANENVNGKSKDGRIGNLDANTNSLRVKQAEEQKRQIAKQEHLKRVERDKKALEEQLKKEKEKKKTQKREKRRL